MISRIKKLYQAIQEIPENKLTQTVIIPVLEKIGYLKVEFYGGQDEEGKDILCWTQDNFGDLELTVAQVKHFKFTNKASDSKSFQTVVNQLSVCFSKEVQYSDNTIHIPAKALLISSKEIDSKNLKSRFSVYPSLNINQIKIVDGLRLSELILAKCPSIASKILDEEIDLSYFSQENLTNEILLKALGFDDKKKIKSIYTDIDFSLGKSSTKLFFNDHFSPKKTFQELTEQQWTNFSISFSLLKREEKDSILNFNQILKRFEFELSELKKWNIEYKLAKIKGNNDEIKLLLENKPQLYYRFYIDGEKIVTFVISLREELLLKLKDFNSNPPSLQDLRKYFLLCKTSFDKAKSLLSNEVVKSVLDINEDIILRESLDTTRLKVPINKIFDTQINLVLLGVAGAGKTTCLQKYALDNKENTDRIFLWIPLPQLVQSKISNDKSEIDKISDIELDVMICSFLRKKNINLSEYEILEIFKRKEIVLLFDALDEAIKNHEWLPNAINQLSNKYKSTVQVIVTSRMSGPFIDELEFISITLLPFTVEQRAQFIENWFENESKVKEQLLRHLKKNSSINEIARNPLLTTALCVLAKHGLPLPKTEIRLYDDRIKLLTGYYDNVKNIPTRVSNTPQNLELLSKKLAHYLHSIHKRELEINLIQEIGIKLTKNILTEEQAKTGVMELIDPCNILVPMTETGKYGFGHLRYQEHLAACELATNRGLEILKILDNVWWKETIIMMVQMCDDISWLINDLGLYCSHPKYQEMINEVIKLRSMDEQQNLNSMIKNFKDEMTLNVDDFTFDMMTGKKY